MAEFLKLAALVPPKSSPVVAMDPHILLAMCALWQGRVLSSLTARVTFFAEPLHSVGSGTDLAVAVKSPAPI